MNHNLIEFSLEWLAIAADDLKWAKDTYADGHWSLRKKPLQKLKKYFSS